MRVTILVGPTSCATARHVITDSLNSHASFRGHGGTAHRTIDGWTCYKPSLGFAGCLQGTRAILGRYSPAGCAPGYDRKLPRAAGGPKYADQINVLSITGVSCTQAAGLAHTFDVPHYSKKSSPHRIVTSLGTFHCHAVKSSASTIEGLCSVGKRRVHWYSARR